MGTHRRVLCFKGLHGVCNQHMWPVPSGAMRAPLARLVLRRFRPFRPLLNTSSRLLCASSVDALERPILGTPIERQFSRANNESASARSEYEGREATFLIEGFKDKKAQMFFQPLDHSDEDGHLSRTIYVTGLEAGDKEAEKLCQAFGNCGEVEGITVVDDLRVLPRGERLKEDVKAQEEEDAGTKKTRVNQRAWSQMQPQQRQRAAFLTFKYKEGKDNALRPALQMLGVVLCTEDQKGGYVVRPHPADSRKTLIARYDSPEDYKSDDEFTDGRLAKDLDLLMEKYLWVTEFKKGQADYCIIKFKNHLAASATLEMLKSEVERLSQEPGSSKGFAKIEFDWALERPKKPYGMVCG